MTVALIREKTHDATNRVEGHVKTEKDTGLIQS